MAAVENEVLSEPFNAVIDEEACPGWNDRDHHLCLAGSCRRQWTLIRSCSDVFLMASTA